MKKFRTGAAVAATLVVGIVMIAGISDVRSGDSARGDYERAVGIARAELSACLADARQAGNEILDSGFPGEGEGDWTIAFCGRQTPTQSPAQFIGGVRLDAWDVAESNCEFPAPTLNPCPNF